MEPSRSEPVASQLVVILGALVLAAISGAATLAGWIAAYAVAWVIVSIAIARGLVPPRAGRTAIVIGALVIAASPIAAIARRLEALAGTESLIGLDENIVDRLRLERSPAIHPALVASDRPQTFFVHAPDAQLLRVTFDGARAIEGEGLGHGLFRIDFDPDVHGIPRPGAIEATIEVDGATSVRAMRSIAPLAHPRWLRVSPDRQRACVTSEETDQVIVVRAGSESIIDLAGGPSDCVFMGDAIVVALRDAGELAWIAEDGTIRARVTLGAAPHRLAVDHAGERLAVTLEQDGLAIVEGSQILARTTLTGTADWVAFGASADVVIVAQHAPAALVRIEIAAGTARITGERGLLAPAVTLAAIDGGARVVIAATDFADELAPHLGNHYVQDQLLAFDATTLALTRQSPTAGRTPRQDAAGGLDRGVSPIGIDEASSGAWWVAFAGSDELARFDPVGAPTRWIDAAPLGLSAPSSVVELADGALIATSPSSGRIAVLDPRGRLVRAIALAPDDAALLRTNPNTLQRRYGERAFYEGTRSGVSCQSCHLHGGTDGMMHNIGGRALVPTLDVRGIAGTSPYLRDGSYPRISDLHVVADELYRGYREPAGDRGANIEAWLASLPLPSSRAPRDPEGERRGLDVFVRAGCPTCHALPAMTNLGRHPVRSVFPTADAEPGASLDTPSLRGVARRDRWLFDGRAASLPAIFTTHGRGVSGGAGRHGHTSTLSDRELADLVTFLESL